MSAAAGRSASLRRDFDASFAAPDTAERQDTEDFLLIGVGGEGFALRLSEVAALLVDRKIVPVPSPIPGLLGIFGLRGTLVPVCDLRSALGYPSETHPRWLIVARAAEPIAVAFDRFDAHRRVAVGSVTAPDHEEHARPHVHGSVSTKDGRYPIIHLVSLLQALVRDRATNTPKER